MFIAVTNSPKIMLLQVVAAVCCFVVTLLMIISICPTDWVDTMETAGSIVKQKEGLFRKCNASNVADKTLPRDLQGCSNQEKGTLPTTTSTCFLFFNIILNCFTFCSYNGSVGHRS